MIRQSKFLRVFVLLICLSFFGCAYNPVSDSYEFSMMGRDRQIEMGREAYPTYTQINNGTLKDPKLQEYVQKLGDRIAAESHDPKLPFQFNIVNSSTVNAYALPGGFISVTRGLLLEMENESELAAVIGHEIVHSVARHSANQMAWGTFSNILTAGVHTALSESGQEQAGLYAGLTNVVGKGLLASYSRSQEAEADRLGMTYMAKAGYDPKGMVDLQKILLRMRKREPNLVEQLFASHPMPEDRIEEAKKRVGSLRKKYQVSEKKQLNKFEQRVTRVWEPREKAYDRYDEGVQLASKGNMSAAAKKFQQAISMYEGEALFHAWLGNTLLEQNQPGKARQALDRAISLNPEVFRIRLFSADQYLKAGAHRESLQELDRADKLLSGVPVVTFLRGRNYEELRRRQEAARAYRKYLEAVQEGKRADYARARLRQWGYLK